RTGSRQVRPRRTREARGPRAAPIRPPLPPLRGGNDVGGRPPRRGGERRLARIHGPRRESWRARAQVRGPTQALTRIVGLTMDAGPRYLEGTTVGSDRDIIGVRRERMHDINRTGREIIP